MNIRDDFSRAWRSLLKSPGFVTVAVLTLGLGIGATSAIFSIVNSVLLKPIDLPDPAQLVFLNGELRNRNIDYFPMSPVDWRDLNEQSDLLDGLAGIGTFPNTLNDDEGDAEQVMSAGVTENFFEVLGVHPFIGRGFNARDALFSAEDVPEGTPFPQNTFVPSKTAVIAFGLWQRRYGGDKEIIGQQLSLGGNKVTIVGVMPEGFQFEMPPEANINPDVDIWLPLRIDYANAPRINVFLNVFGRLKPDITLEQAQGQLKAYEQRMKEQFEINRTADWVLNYRDFHKAMTAGVRQSVLILMAAVFFVLLIACANVANLMLVRASSRSREIAIRAALGGNQRHLMRQMLLEAGLLAVGGAILGLALAEGGIRILHALGPDSLPRASSIGLDLNVLVFTVITAAIATLGAGLLPALRSSQPDMVNQLRERSSNARSSGGKRFRDGMVVLEIMLSFVLLVGAGLMVRSFITLQNTDPGFKPEGVLTFTLNLPNDKYPLFEEQISFLDQFQERLKGLPGVESVGANAPLPLTGQASNGRYASEADSGDPEAFKQANYHFLKGEYFQTMKTRLLAGRLLDRNDEISAQPLILIDDLMAGRVFPDQDPVGQKLMIRLLAPQPILVEIVGVVAHQVQDQLQEEGRESIYMVPEFGKFGAFLNWAVRSEADPMALLGPIKALVKEMDRDVQVNQIMLMTEYVEVARAPTWFALSLISLFGVIALILASIGLYSVLSYIVRLRQSEIGVRIAFGATPNRIFKLVVGRGLALTVIGVGIGVAVGLSVTRLMQSILVGVSPTDPLTFTSIAILFLIVAFVAAYLPARRATQVDPIISLRQE